MSTKLYVGGLPYSTTDAELSEQFTQYGSVTSAKVITDKFTGQSRGFGFVEMGTTEEAKKAIDGLNGSKLQQRTIVVNEAKPQEKRERSAARW
jgi:RNA recognition motif-containing protein